MQIRGWIHYLLKWKHDLYILHYIHILYIIGCTSRNALTLQSVHRIIIKQVTITINRLFLFSQTRNTIKIVIQLSIHQLVSWLKQLWIGNELLISLLERFHVSNANCDRMQSLFPLHTSFSEHNLDRYTFVISH
jgi:hypothetical protein